ncbi:MAG: GMC family oxidoreductase [Halomonadaceae bacterium]|nr:MAG: GMC family oxidoreductase [Halomonadaceae bacterium]
MSNKNKSTHAHFSRRTFLGLSALSTASALGLTTVSLGTPGQAQASWFSRPWLAQPHKPEPIASHYSAIVVGSGYGGAVAALRLGEAGVDTLMLEMGMLWNQPASDGNVFCKMSSPDGRAMWFRDRTEAPLDRIFGLDLVNRNIEHYPGVLDRLNYPNMSVYLGRGVGGGSLVNGGMAVVPRRDLLERILPDVSTAEMYQHYFPKASAMLGVNSASRALLDSRYYRFTRVGQRTAERAGFRMVDVPGVYDFDYMLREARGQAPQSGLDQEVIYGNNAGKQTLDKNYLPAALGTGHVTLRAMTRVTGIRTDANGTYYLALETIDVNGTVTETREISCQQLFLAAGCVGTTELLLRARETGTLPELNDQIGLGWGNNGNFMAARGNRLLDYTGARQSGFPISGIDNWDDPRNPAFVEIAPLPTGFETWASLYLAITDNPERGHFSYDRAQDKAILHWAAHQSRPSYEMTTAVLDRINDANRTDYRRGLFAGNRFYADNFTYHPLGGCLLGKATDDRGGVRGYQNLFVIDGSLLPGNVGVNPFLTITALAERNMHHILKGSN